ncbi:MAG: CDP-diacylglycerol--serine O-phosphatidyltransferase [Bacteroidales bacterium]|nr:CDP-diacylglycerol--serine O-phosphatidyltransferase [Bacteroidales bacterium]
MSIRKHIPNTITLMNLLCGILGVICAVRGRPYLAFPLMLAAAVFDFCDGLAARLLGAYSVIGKELDSLSDMVSFGVLPALMLVHGAQETGLQPGWLCYIPLFLALMSALRLAKFNVDERQGTDFIGVATPAAAIMSGALCYSGLALPGWFFPCFSVVMGLLLVSEIPMFSIKIAKGHKLLDAKHIVLLALVAASIVVTAALRLNWSIAVLLIFSSYVVENLVIACLPKSRRR